MLEKLDFDQILAQNEKKICELEAENERLCREIDQYFESTGIKREEFEAFLSNPDNFTKEGWEMLEKERKRFDQDLEKKIGDTRNPSEAKKKLSSLNLPSYAIFVK